MAQSVKNPPAMRETWVQSLGGENDKTSCCYCCCCSVAQSCPTLCHSMDCGPPGSSVHGDSPCKNIGVDCHALLHGIVPTQGSNPGIQHCRCILYQLSHQGSSRILEWVAYPFSSGSSQAKIELESLSCIAGRFFTS